MPIAVRATMYNHKHPIAANVRSAANIEYSTVAIRVQATPMQMSRKSGVQRALLLPTIRRVDRRC